MPSVAAVPSQVSFNSTAVGSVSATKTAYVYNNQLVTLHISGVWIAQQAFAETDDCGAIMPHGGCTIQVVFIPSSAGKVNGSIQINHDARTSLVANPLVIALSGVGTGGSAPTSTPHATPAPTARPTPRPKPTRIPTPTPTPSATPTPAPADAALGVTPRRVNLGVEAVAQRAGAERIRKVVLSNPKNRKQDATIMIESVTASGEFEVPGGSCVGPLAPGHKCVVDVSFSPSSAGPKSGALTVISNASNPVEAVSLAGKGTGGSK